MCGPCAEYSNSRQKCQQSDVSTRRTSQRNICNTTEPLPVGSPGTGDKGETPGGARRQLPVAKLHPGSHKHAVVQNLLPRRPAFSRMNFASSKTELASCSGNGASRGQPQTFRQPRFWLNLSSISRSRTWSSVER